MAKTEEQLFLERMGVLQTESSVHDSDFEVESAIAEESFAEMEQERERLDAWQSQLEDKERELRQREDELNKLIRQNDKENRRLRNLKMQIDSEYERLESKPDGTVLDDGAIDEYRRKKKAERLIKNREGALDTEVPSVWSTSGWNT